MEDEKIIELFFARSQQAITETADKYGAYLNEVAFRLVRSREDTEEIVNDTYLGAWNAIPPQRPQVLRHFLSRITRNLSLNRLDLASAEKRRHQQVLLDELEECVPAGESVEQAWESREIGRSLNRFFGTLDREALAVFLCRYYDAMTGKEIARRFSLSERRVKYLLSRTRRQLKLHLEKEDVIL